MPPEPEAPNKMCPYGKANEYGVLFLGATSKEFRFPNDAYIIADNLELEHKSCGHQVLVQVLEGTEGRYGRLDNTESESVSAI